MPDFRTELINRGGKVYQKEALVLDNGAKIVKLETSPEMQSLFLYSDGQYSFDFTAFRWTEDLRPVDTWTVLLGFALNRLPSSQQRQLTPADAQNIANNIGEALKAWPMRKLEADVPLKRIRFLMDEWRRWAGKNIDREV